MTKYSIDYFINKFEGIPEDLWLEGDLGDNDGPHCAAGFVGVNTTNLNDSNIPLEAQELATILQDYYTITASPYIPYSYYSKIFYINDGAELSGHQKITTTPKQRIVSTLKLIKEHRNKQENAQQDKVSLVQCKSGDS